jgi:CRP-like cAMP-binding protein
MVGMRIPAQPSSAAASIRLLDVEPDLARFLNDGERAAAAALVVPVRRLGRGPVEIESTLEEASAFGGIILSGMLLQSVRVGEQPALRLLGPGDVISLSSGGRSLLVSEAACSAPAPTDLALLGNEVLLAARRFPHLTSGLAVRIAEQSERLSTQLAICQLPRVDQRVLAVLWLLAESWGHVTRSGTTLPVSLTHEALGALVGARRPTVTLALGELADRGAVVRQDQGWLLLESPPRPERPAPAVEAPVLLERLPSAWAAPTPTADPSDRFAELSETVRILREQHVRSRQQVQQRLAALVASRDRMSESRRQIRLRERQRPEAPSS